MAQRKLQREQKRLWNYIKDSIVTDTMAFSVKKESYRMQPLLRNMSGNRTLSGCKILTMWYYEVCSWGRRSRH